MGRHHLDISKARHKIMVRKSYTLLSYQTTSSLNYTTFVWRYKVWAEFFFMAKVYPLLKIIMTSTGWKAVGFKRIGIISARTQISPTIFQCSTINSNRPGEYNRAWDMEGGWAPNYLFYIVWTVRKIWLNDSYIFIPIGWKF